MTNLLTRLRDVLTGGHGDRAFLRAAMGTGALIAMADDEVTFAELMARDYLLDNIEELHVFDPHEAADLFRDYAEAIALDRETGKAKVFEEVVQFMGDEKMAPLLVKVGVAISKADYDFSEREHAAIEELCEVLGVEPPTASDEAFPSES